MSENAVGQEMGSESGPPRRRQRRLVTRLLIGVAALLVVALGAGAAYVYSINRSVTQNISRQDNLPAESPTAAGQSPRPPKLETGALNYVLLGSDSRDPDNSGNGRSLTPRNRSRNPPGTVNT